MEILALLLALPIFAGLFDIDDGPEENTAGSDVDSSDLDANGSDITPSQEGSSMLDMLNPQMTNELPSESREEAAQSLLPTSSTDGDEDDNFIRTVRGDDLVNGFGGNDTIAAGRGDDFVQGGQGQDEIAGQGGDDILHWDDGSTAVQSVGGTLDTTPVTTSNSTNIPSTGQELTVSLTAADGSDSDSLRISGNVTSSDVSQGGVNIAIVVDASGSTSSGYVGDPVGDQNGDGRENTVLDAEIAGVGRLVEEIRDAGFPNANISIIEFDSSANTVFQGSLSEDQDGNGTPDALDSVQTLQSGGGTNFDDALGKAEAFLSTQSTGSNFVFFLSDGNASVQDTSVAPVINPNGIDAEIRAFAVGERANIDSLDILDDLQDNDSATRVNDLSDLGVALSGSAGVTASSIGGVEILVDSVVVETLDPATLTTTPFGLSYDFEITGLDPDAAETVEVRVVASDADATTVSTSQVVEAPGQTTTTVGADDTLFGGNGDDLIFGHGGNDVMYGQRGDDIINGGNGSDTLIGGDHDDVLDGGDGADVINGGRGDDALFLDDGDIATGGGGTDTFEIGLENQNPASVTFTDFNPSQDVFLIDTNGAHAGKLPTITERSDGSGIEVSVGGAVLASISGVTGISPSEIVLR